VAVVGANGDGDDHDSVSSDSGRGPSEEEFRAISLHPQQPPHVPPCRIHNGAFNSTALLYKLIVTD